MGIVSHQTNTFCNHFWQSKPGGKFINFQYGFAYVKQKWPGYAFLVKKGSSYGILKFELDREPNTLVPFALWGKSLDGVLDAHCYNFVPSNQMDDNAVQKEMQILRTIVDTQHDVFKRLTFSNLGLEMVLLESAQYRLNTILRIRSVMSATINMMYHQRFGPEIICKIFQYPCPTLGDDMHIVHIKEHTVNSTNVAMLGSTFEYMLGYCSLWNKSVLTSTVPIGKYRLRRMHPLDRSNEVSNEIYKIGVVLSTPLPDLQQLQSIEYVYNRYNEKVDGRYLIDGKAFEVYHQVYNIKSKVPERFLERVKIH